VRRTKRATRAALPVALVGIALSLVAPARAQSSAADALTARVSAAAGDPNAVGELRFTFVVARDGAEVVRRSHRWRPTEGIVEVSAGSDTVRITTGGADPSPWTADPAAHASEWAVAAPGVAPEAAAAAWTQFINDSFWLLAPAKLSQPGALRELDGDVLVVRYESGGVTPGDLYRLTIDPSTALVTRWEYVLGSGREGHANWSDYETFGPLTLSLRRTSDDGSFVITFEDVAVE
jgi:hypothetical protein